MARALGIDFGEKRVGLALSDRSNLIASPYKTLQYISENDKGGAHDFKMK